MEKKQTIAEIRERLSQITDPEDAVFAELLQDTRKGIQLEIKRWQNNYQKKNTVTSTSRNDVIPRKCII